MNAENYNGMIIIFSVIGELGLFSLLCWIVFKTIIKIMEFFE